MALYVIFVLLLTGHLVLGAENVIGIVGSYVNLKTQLTGNTSKCILETNYGEKITYGRGYSRIREDIAKIDYEKCSVRIDRINSIHAGVWKVTTYIVPQEDKKLGRNSDNLTTEVFTFNLYIQKKATISLESFEVYDGHYISTKHSENYENLTACKLTSSREESINLLTETRKDLQLFGQCGVRMKVNSNSSGYWELLATENDFILHLASFNIRVYEKEKAQDPDNMLTYQWIRGTDNIVSLPKIRNPKICQIIDPRGVIVATTYDECSYRVKMTTVQHEGVWVARYNVHWMMEPIEQQFRIKTVDREIFNSSVDRTTEDGSAKLRCRVELQSASYMKLCSFVRPDGKILYMIPQVDDGRYASYINPWYLLASKNLTCELIIRKLERVDYGAWRCNIETSLSSERYGSVLRVGNPDSSGAGSVVDRVIANIIRASPARRQVHVKRGDSFTITCAVDFALKYCWLRSPNGTAYSITRDEDVDSPFVLGYKGDGLAFGECGAQIPAAMDSDDGQWSCFMGVVNGSEEATTVSVTVTDTYLVAEQMEIPVFSRNMQVLSCHILPHMLDRTVHYCRWIRPDGYGIYNDMKHRYTTKSNHSQCRLVILNYYPREDDGIWTCVAGLEGKNGNLEEAWSHIKTQSFNVLSNTFFISMIAAISVLMIGGLFIIGHFAIKKSKRRAASATPAFYDPQEYCHPSKTSQLEHSKENQYQ